MRMRAFESFRHWRRIAVVAVLWTWAALSGETQTFACPESLSPGDPAFCEVSSPVPLQDLRLTLLDGSGAAVAAAAPFYRPSGEGIHRYGFFLPIPLRAAPGEGRLMVKLRTAADTEAAAAEIVLEKPLRIVARTFLREDIPLDSANTALRTLPDPLKTAESREFAAIFEERDMLALFASGSMTRPLAASWRITAGFGDERRYLYQGGGSDSVRHGGIDLGAPTGTEVLACAAGRVVFARPRIVTGNTVVIEHLPGLFSIYMHLSSMDAREGSILAQGERLGRVGSTGLSTGPHLHWELRIGGISVNPLYWLAHPLLDKE